MISLKSKKYKSKFFIVLVFMAFLISKLSLFNCLGYVRVTDAKLIIRDFEKCYLYNSIFQEPEYKQIKKNLFNNKYISKLKIYEMVEEVKKLTKDEHTEIKYVDFLQGKFDYLFQKRTRFYKKNIKSDTIYIKINNFNQSSAIKFSKTLDANRDIDNIILDLRGNCTGSYEEAIQIADDLLPSGCPIVQIQCSSSNHNYFSNTLYYDFKKIYILVDESSGFCSKIVALALKENLEDKVKIIGNIRNESEIGLVFLEYNNKIGFNIASLRWQVNGKGIEELSRYMNNSEEIEYQNYKNANDLFH